MIDYTNTYILLGYEPPSELPKKEKNFLEKIVDKIKKIFNNKVRMER